MTASAKILIVDDKPQNLFALDKVLEETGAEVIQAINGNDALAATLHHDFALAILDIQMPGMDGYELAEWLRGEERTKELPIIFVSAVYSSEYHIFRGYDAGAVDFIVKPYEPAVLLSKVRVFLQLYRQRFELEQSRAMLVKVNENLEEKVRERTAELEAAVKGLKLENAKRAIAEQQALEAKQSWHEIFEAIGQMVLILGPDHTILDANQTALNYMETDKEALIGKKCHTVFHGLESAGNNCPLEELRNSDQFGLTESEVNIAGRTYIVSCTPILDEGGELLKIIHIATDITHQKQLKKELIQAHKMEAIGTLAGGIAHDFNNILAVIIGFAELALEIAEKDTEMDENLMEIKTAGLRAKALVQQILTFARQKEEKLDPVQLDLIVKEVIKFLRSTIPSTIEIRENIDSNALVLANPVKIHQLIMNLCTNASHAMDEKGVLEISLTQVHFDTDDFTQYTDLQPGVYHKLQVADTGAGIPEEIVNSIFLPFFTTKNIDEGTGMGLATVHTIVKECSGEVSVESEVGKGSLFTILLPAHYDEQPDAAEPGSRAAAQGFEKILVVDDEESICKLAGKMLASCGYKITLHKDSRKALKLFYENPFYFDLIITDMTMPNISGDEFTRQVMLARPDTPVIITTGYSKRMSPAVALDYGAKALIHKPFVKEILLKVVREVLDGTYVLSTTT